MRLTQTRHPSPRATTASLILLTGCLMLATPTLAQQRVSNPGDGRAPGMRYLTWPGKNERPRLAPTVSNARAQSDAEVEYAPANSAAPVERDDQPASRGPILSMPSQPLVGPVATRYSARTSPGPTPASAWITQRGTPASSAPTYASPPYDPTPTAAFVPAPPLESAVRSLAPAPYAARVATLPEPPRGYAPVVPLDAPAPPAERFVEAPVRAPVYEQPRYDARPVAADTGPAAEPPVPEPMPLRAPVTDAPAPEEAPPAAPAVDPYAPRPDAPIFRLLNRNSQPAPVPSAAPEPDATTPQTATPASAPSVAPQPYPATAADPDRTPRRYSVHRANGQSPDRVPLPDPVLLDSAPVDLAEPPEAPTVVRNVNGRLTAITPASEDPAQP